MFTKHLFRVAGIVWLLSCGVALLVCAGLYVAALVNQSGPLPVPEAAFRLPAISLLTAGVALLVSPVGFAALHASR